MGWKGYMSCIVRRHSTAYARDIFQCDGAGKKLFGKKMSFSNGFSTFWISSQRPGLKARLLGLGDRTGA